MPGKTKELSPADVKEVLSLTKKDITGALLRDYFAASVDREMRFNTYDTFTLPINRFYNKESIKTTIGRYIINLFCLPKQYLEKYGYENVVWDKGNIERIEGRLASMLLNDELTSKEYADILDSTEWISMSTVYYMCPTMTLGFYKPIPAVIKRRDELFEENKEALENGDTSVSSKIEAELLDMAKKEIKKSGSESIDFYDSGNGAFDNNYKKSSVFGSAVKDPFTQKVSIIKSNYMEGVTKKEIPPLASLTVVGGYSKGVETQKSGYETKKINNATQTVVLDEPGTDCGTPFYLKFTIQDELKKLYLYRYILENGKLVMLTEDNIGKYVGKEVMMRSPMYCKSDKICNKCAGEFFYKLGIKNAGLLTSTFSGSLLNRSMKAFHDSAIRYFDIDIEKFIEEVK